MKSEESSKLSEVSRDKAAVLERLKKYEGLLNEANTRHERMTEPEINYLNFESSECGSVSISHDLIEGANRPQRQDYINLHETFEAPSKQNEVDKFKQFFNQMNLSSKSSSSNAPRHGRKEASSAQGSTMKKYVAKMLETVRQLV